MLFCLRKYLIEYFLNVFCLCFKCSKFLHEKKKKIKNCPDSLNIYTTWVNFTNEEMERCQELVDQLKICLEDLREKKEAEIRTKQDVMQEKSL